MTDKLIMTEEPCPYCDRLVEIWESWCMTDKVIINGKYGNNCDG